MKLHKWKDIREKKLSPEQLRKVDEEVEQELLKMDLRALRPDPNRRCIPARK